jgi:NTP pyrophosphatase (non-canonical NTP hydrolase)
MSKPIDVKHLGKLAEECGELTAAISRCLIQGIDECEPVTGKPNRQWLQDEIADVLANIDLVSRHFDLDKAAIRARVAKKTEHLQQWHTMTGPKTEDNCPKCGSIVHFDSGPRGSGLWVCTNPRCDYEGMST